MSGYVMTISDQEDGYGSSSSDLSGEELDKDTGICLDFDIGGPLSSKKHAWNFDSARKDVLGPAIPKKSVDDIIKKRIESGLMKDILPLDSDSENDGSNEEEDDENDSNEEEDENDSNEEEDENDSNEEEDENDSNEEEDENDSDLDDPKKKKPECISELRDITRKVTKKSTQRDLMLESKRSFDQFSLSRPLLRALTEFGFEIPTPIQSACIPQALKGRDICASAVTGSGKTAAFVIPVLERLFYREETLLVTRVLILTPTRELAVQCHSVVQNLAKYTNEISCALITGGMVGTKQQIDLRSRPDIIVATPGRVLDHLLNTQAFGLEGIEVLILDEADRLLELGFSNQLQEIVDACPRARQTMLFSATMTEGVSNLINLSLNNPVSLTIDPMYQVARKLTQEFVRIRKDTDEEKDASLLSLCTRVCKNKTLVFCTHKMVAHRLKILFTLSGLNSVELHGDLTQIQRFDSLEKFRDQEADFLIASDVAARGLDVSGIETVINYEMPINLSGYVHRVGRTARAGRSGRAISFITEFDRKLFKLVVKSSRGPVKRRVIDNKSLEKWMEKVESMKAEVNAILTDERQERLIRTTEMEALRASNIIEHHDEISARPPKTWIMSKRETAKVGRESRQIALSQNGDGDVDIDDSKSKKRTRSDFRSSIPPVPQKKISKSKKKRKVVKSDLSEMSHQRACAKRNRKPGSAKASNFVPSKQPRNPKGTFSKDKNKSKRGPGKREERSKRDESRIGRGKTGRTKSKSRHKRR